MSEQKDILTENEKNMVYEKLADIDSASVEALKNANEETENSNYEEITEQDIDIGDLTGIDTTVYETESDYNEVFKEYNLTNDDIIILSELIQKYKNNIDMNYYEAIPKSIKKLADGIRIASISQGMKCTKNDSAKFIIKEMIHDAKMANAFNTFTNDLSQSVVEMNEKYNQYLTEAFDEAFKNIDKIEIENPEQAEKIKKVKAAFDNAITFDKQLEYIEKTTVNKLNKYSKRYYNEVAYFNNLVNVTDVKIPNIGELLTIIQNMLPEYDIEDIKKFIVVICKSSYDIDMNDVIQLAYIYKMINSIYEAKFIAQKQMPEVTQKVFGNISKVITAIINKK